MGVYIKGMTMPKSCFECKLDLRTDICQAFCEWNAEHPYSIRGKDRLPDCPLDEVPEPHGRLIDSDADSLRNKLKIINEAEHQIYGRASWGFTAKCINAFDDAPTVVEAEGAEE